MKRTAAMTAALCALAVLAVEAQPLTDAHLAQASAVKSAAPMTDAEVRKVDKEARKITLKHEQLTHLDMPAMTMVFQVKDKAMLDAVKPGDKIRFVADKVNGAFTIMQLEPVR